MNKRFLVIGGLAALMTGGCLMAETTPPEQPAEKMPSGDATIATINGQEIPLDLFRRFYVERLRQTHGENTAAFQNRAFNEFVNVLVTAQDAQKNELDKDKNFKLALEMKRLELLSGFAIQNAANTLEPSEEELKQAYDERYGKKQMEYKARHILVKTEDEAKKLIEELKGGADFAELAKTKSLGPTGKNGGELQWFSAGQMVKPFAEATATLKSGEYSSEPVQTQFGWHVILLEETRESKPPALQDVKDELTQSLRQAKVMSYVSELRDNAKLDVNPDMIKMSKPDESEPKESAESTESKEPKESK